VGKRSNLISIVVPLYNEEDLVVQLHAEVASSMNGLCRPWEVVYVNDGSRDATLEILLEQRANDPHVVIVDLSRNWGHQSALSAGLSVAQGAAVVMMDGDLQDPPSMIPALVVRWEAGAKVVIAEREQRPESGFRGFLFWLFYKILAAISDFPIPLNAGVFGLLDRKVVDEIVSLAETNRFLPGLRSWVGYSTAVVTYKRAERAAGEPKQRLGTLVRYACDAFFGFSYKPLRLSHVLGTSSVLFAMLLTGAWALRLVPGGWAGAVVASIFLMGGIQLICVGILGEYIGRIYDDVRRRPLFLIQQVYRDCAGGNPTARSVADLVVPERLEPSRTNGAPNTDVHLIS
jgi:polyisoprenyl-phosphate glycosyltransferase